ncbi:MAG: PQQ-like beta-propeller repeat protein, partial [Acidobacteriota bacterium]|nr:PQQ-like beta-propeller repeat protein [Acidobacteriota bacterium]
MKRLLAVCLLLFAAGISAGFAASSAAVEDHWPQWRGPFFNGVARGNAPTEWSETKNIRWKTPIAGRGFSTPIVWGNKIFLTTAMPTGKIDNQAVAAGDAQRTNPNGGVGTGAEQKFMVICLDRKTGKTLWERVAKTAVPHEGFHRQYGSFASNSPATDGKFVYVSFGSRGVYCYDLDGKLIWEKDLGVKMQMRLQFGEGTAPLLAGDQLILNYDHQAGSFIAALDKRTGKELWRMKREEVSAWAMPLLIEHKGRKQIVVSATNKVRAYAPEDGKVIWECAGLGVNVIPAPVWQGDLVYAMSGFRDPKLMAIRLGKEGDLTGSDAIVWSQTRGMSYTPSPVLHDNKIYTLTDNGMLSCFDAATGKPFYQQQRLPQAENFKASPIAADG